MLSRRENLLIRPWQERRYIQHRRKVKAALPAIDNSPPPFRKHVCYKLKKIQKESERCTQIISDNFTLLQHLSCIMSTTRVDHFWEEPLPNFLQRVGIYGITSHSESEKDEQEELPPPKNRKEKCHACSPHRYKSPVAYDVRRPYTPPKERISKKSEQLPNWETQFRSRCDEDRLEFRGKIWKKPNDGRKDLNKAKPKRSAVKLFSGAIIDSDEPKEESQCISLSRGGLSVAVKLPAQTDVFISSTTETEVVKKQLSECKFFPKISRRSKTLKSKKNV